MTLRRRLVRSFTIVCWALIGMCAVVAGPRGLTAADGMLDPTYGVGGNAILAGTGGRSTDLASGFAAHGSGYLVVGHSYTSFSTSGVVRKVTIIGVGNTPDNTFGVRGDVILALGKHTYLTAVAVQADSKILVAGNIRTSGHYSRPIVARLTAVGQLDATWSDDGVQVIDIEGAFAAIALQSDGKVVVAGRRQMGGGNQPLAMRLTSTGAVDVSFSGDGVLDAVPTISAAEPAAFTAVAVQGNGALAWAGYAGSTRSVLAVRTSPTGTYDVGFSADGVKLFQYAGTTSTANAVLVGADLKMVLVGEANSGEAGLARLTAAGELDPSWSTDGVLTATFEIGAIATAACFDGTNVVVAIAPLISNRFEIWRFTSAGAFDTAFSSDGREVSLTVSSTYYPKAAAVLRRTDGSYLITGTLEYRFGSSEDSSQFVSLCTSVGGSFHPISHNVKGVSQEIGTAVAIRPDGRAVVAGSVYDVYQKKGIAIGVTAGGMRDRGFATNGIHSVAGLYTSHLAALALTSTGETYLAGTSAASGAPTWRAFLERLNPTGMQDSTFNGGSGRRQDSFGLTSGTAVGVHALGANVVIAGTAITADYHNRFALLGTNASGLDNPALPASTSVIEGMDTTAVASAVDASGRLLIAGQIYAPFSTPVIARFSGPALDSTFGGDGAVVLDWPGANRAGISAVLPLADGRILVAGWYNDYNARLVVARLTPSGDLDPTFGGGDGMATLVALGAGNSGFMLNATAEEGLGLAVQSNGRIVVACTSVQEVATLVGLHANGTLDTEFGVNGYSSQNATISSGYQALVVVGNLAYAGGYRGPDMLLARHVLDSTPPAAPVISAPAEGAFLASTTLTMSGTAEAGSTISASTGGGVVGTTVTDVGGAWTLIINGLAQGPSTWSVTAADSQAQISTPSTVSLTVDTVAPAAPMITAPSAGAVVTATTPSVSGTAEAFVTITIREGGAVIGTTTANGSGAWTASITTLSDGPHRVAATATDRAGNMGPASSERMFTIDGPPRVFFVGPTPTNAIPVVVTGLFSESVTGFIPANDVVVTGGTATFLIVTPLSFEISIVPAGDGMLTITMPAGAVQDADANTNLVTATGVISDRTVPTATLTPSSVSVRVGTTLAWALSLSEPIAPLTLTSFTVSGGTAVSISGSGTAYTLMATATAVGTMVVATNGVTDLAGNALGSTTASAVVTASPSPVSGGADVGGGGGGGCGLGGGLAAFVLAALGSLQHWRLRRGR